VGKRRRRGGKRATWHSFPADACCNATARCPAAKLFPFAAPLLGVGDETSGEDEASVVPLIVGHAVSHAFREGGGRVEMPVDRVREGAKKNREAT
jgi:hypothetical protein